MVREESAGVGQGTAKHVRHVGLRMAAAPRSASARQKEPETIRVVGIAVLVAQLLRDREVPAKAEGRRRI